MLFLIVSMYRLFILYKRLALSAYKVNSKIKLDLTSWDEGIEIFSQALPLRIFYSCLAWEYLDLALWESISYSNITKYLIHTFALSQRTHSIIYDALLDMFKQ